MQFQYETERLKLKVLNETYAGQSLHFYKEGAPVFNPVEPEKPANYYTERYQIALLRGEYQAFLQGQYLRYYLYRLEEPNLIIGTVSFSDIKKGAYRSCILGYKLLPAYWRQGFATEAVSHLITALFEENQMHRIEAYTLSDNYASIGLLLRLGFSFESVANSVIRLNGRYVDHNRYYLINPLD